MVFRASADEGLVIVSADFHANNIRVPQVLLRHKKLETTSIYAHVATDLLREVIGPWSPCRQPEGVVQPPWRSLTNPTSMVLPGVSASAAI